MAIWGRTLRGSERPDGGRGRNTATEATTRPGTRHERRRGGGKGDTHRMLRDARSSGMSGPPSQVSAGGGGSDEAGQGSAGPLGADPRRRRAGGLPRRRRVRSTEKKRSASGSRNIKEVRASRRCAGRWASRGGAVGRWFAAAAGGGKKCERLKKKNRRQLL